MIKKRRRKKENEMMTKILKNEIRNIEQKQKQEIEKRQKEERKVKVRVGEKLVRTRKV